jgi:hypothetical protein
VELQLMFATARVNVLLAPDIAKYRQAFFAGRSLTTRCGCAALLARRFSLQPALARPRSLSEWGLTIADLGTGVLV